jgi:hypothetical protein
VALLCDSSLAVRRSARRGGAAVGVGGMRPAMRSRTRSDSSATASCAAAPAAAAPADGAPDALARTLPLPLPSPLLALLRERRTPFSSSTRTRPAA